MFRLWRRAFRQWIAEHITRAINDEHWNTRIQIWVNGHLVDQKSLFELKTEFPAGAIRFEYLAEKFQPVDSCRAGRVEAFPTEGQTLL